MIAAGTAPSPRTCSGDQGSACPSSAVLIARWTAEQVRGDEVVTSANGGKRIDNSWRTSHEDIVTGLYSKAIAETSVRALLLAGGLIFTASSVALPARSTTYDNGFHVNEKICSLEAMRSGHTQRCTTDEIHKNLTPLTRPEILDLVLKHKFGGYPLSTEEEFLPRGLYHFSTQFGVYVGSYYVASSKLCTILSNNKRCRLLFLAPSGKVLSMEEYEGQQSWAEFKPNDHKEHINITPGP